MSRSRRKTPICSITCSGFSKGEKKDKRSAQRKLRSKTKQLLKQGIEVDLTVRDVSNICLMDKDGKQKFDPEKHPELMRK